MFTTKGENLKQFQQAAALKLYLLAKETLVFLHRFPFSRSLTFSLARKQASQMWQVVSIEPHNVCDLRCKMCPYVDTTRRKEQMSMELYQKIVDDAVDAGINFLNLSFYNEPFLDSLIFDRIGYAKGKGLRVEFFSNGKSLTQEKISSILDTEVDRITFSFDGASKQTYEKIRIGGDFERTKDNILALLQERRRRGLKRPFVNISLVAQEDNQRELKQFLRLWTTFADQVAIWPVDNRKQAGLPVENLRIGQKHPYPCVRLLHDELVVMSNGKVALCCRDYDGSVILGDLCRQSIKEVRASAVYKEISRLHLAGKGDAIPLCEKCGYLYTCHFIWWLRYFSHIYPLSRLARRLREPL